MTKSSTTQRIDWVDYAKGICIVMVVMMHSTLGVEAAAGRTGWMHTVVEFARPFRMPDFFLISGLFLSQVIDRDWRTYLDRKVVHFVYFLLLWTAIQFAVKAPGLIAEQGVAATAFAYLESFIEPFGTLWFIYLLPVFFVVVKLTRNTSPLIIWSIAAGLEISHLHTGWTVPDEFAARFVYFYTGYILAAHVFRSADEVRTNPWKGVLLLALWAPVNAFMVVAGWSTLPGVSLALGLIGAMAIVRIATLVSLAPKLGALRYCGENSIVIYLAFFLPMAATRAVLLKTGIVSDLGTVSVIVTTVGVVGSLCLYWALRNTPARFLYVRPQAFRLENQARPALQPAE